MLTVADINAMMPVGNVLMNESFDDPQVLFEIASRGETYVEIGTRWGGSAIIAGLAGCEVHCIDAFEYPTRNAFLVGTPEDVTKNWINAGLNTDKLHIYKQKHPPFPEEITDNVFDVGLIDSEHFWQQCDMDWKALRMRVMKYVLFHDIGVDAVMGVFEEAALETEWEIEELSLESQFGILKRCVPSL